MSGFGASFGGDEEDVVESSGAGDSQTPLSAPGEVDVEMSGTSGIVQEPADEPETLDVLAARRLAALPIDNLLQALETGDWSDKTKLFAVSLHLEDHTAKLSRLWRAKDALSGYGRGGYADPSYDARAHAYAKNKARSAFRDSGGHGPFAVVDTAKDAVRFAARQVLDRVGRRLLALADRFR